MLLSCDTQCVKVNMCQKGICLIKQILQNPLFKLVTLCIKHSDKNLNLFVYLVWFYILNLSKFTCSMSSFLCRTCMSSILFPMLKFSQPIPLKYCHFLSLFIFIVILSQFAMCIYFL